MPSILNEKIIHCLAEIKQAIGITPITFTDKDGNSETFPALGEHFDEEHLLGAISQLFLAIKEQKDPAGDIEEMAKELIRESDIKNFFLMKEARQKLKAIIDTLSLIYKHDETFGNEILTFATCIEAILDAVRNNAEYQQDQYDSARSGKYSTATLDWFGFPTIEVADDTLAVLTQITQENLKIASANHERQLGNACREIPTYYFDQLSNQANENIFEVGKNENRAEQSSDSDKLSDAAGILQDNIADSLSVSKDVAKDFILYGHAQGYVKDLYAVLGQTKVNDEVVEEIDRGRQKIKSDTAIKTQTVNALMLGIFPNNAALSSKHNGIEHKINFSVNNLVLNKCFCNLPKNEPYAIVECTLNILPSTTAEANIQIDDIKIYPVQSSVTKHLINENLLKNCVTTDAHEMVKTKLAGHDEDFNEISKLRFAIKKTGNRKDILDFQELNGMLHNSPKTSPEKLFSFSARQQQIAAANSNPHIQEMAAIVANNIAIMTPNFSIQDIKDFNTLKEMYQSILSLSYDDSFFLSEQKIQTMNAIATKEKTLIKNNSNNEIKKFAMLVENEMKNLTLKQTKRMQRYELLKTRLSFIQKTLGLKETTSLEETLTIKPKSNYQKEFIEKLNIYLYTDHAKEDNGLEFLKNSFNDIVKKYNRNWLEIFKDFLRFNFIKPVKQKNQIGQLQQLLNSLPKPKTHGCESGSQIMQKLHPAAAIAGRKSKMNAQAAATAGDKVVQVRQSTQAQAKDELKTLIAAAKKCEIITKNKHSELFKWMTAKPISKPTEKPMSASHQQIHDKVAGLGQ